MFPAGHLHQRPNPRVKTGGLGRGASFAGRMEVPKGTWRICRWRNQGQEKEVTFDSDSSDSESSESESESSESEDDINDVKRRLHKMKKRKNRGQ